jgi:hypothetical protein
MKKLIILSFLLLIGFIGYSQGGPPSTSTIVDGNWSDPTVWSNGLPASNKDATINHNIIIDTYAPSRNIIINGSLTNNGYLIEAINFTNNGTYTDNGGTLEIRQNGTISGNDTYFYNLSVKGGSITNITYIKNLLNVPSGNFNVTSGTLTLLNDGTNDGRLGSVVGNISGTFIWEKHVTTCAGWSMYSFPADASLATINFTRWYWTAYYDEASTGDMDNGWVYYTSTSDVVPRGNGVFNYDYGYTKIFSVPTTLQNIFDYTINFTNNFGPADDGWNLVGNPYAGTIDWDNPNWTKTSLANAIYSWSDCSGAYGSYINGIGTGGMDGIIASGEAFWVQATAGGAALTAPKSVIVDDSEPMFKATNNQNKNILRLELNGDDIVIALRGGTEYYDTDMDAIKMSEGYIKTMDVDGIEYSINSLPSSDVTIPLHTKGNGVMVLTKEAFNNGWKIYLEDTYSGTKELVGANHTHNIQGNSNTYEHRYNVIFSRRVIKDDFGSPIKPSKNYRFSQSNDRIIVVGEENLEIYMFDALGRVIDIRNTQSLDVNKGNIRFLKINSNFEKVF